MLQALRRKVSKRLFPLPSPKLLDAGETALGGMLSPEVMSTSVMDILAMPDTMALGGLEGFARPVGELAIPVDLARPKIIGKGLTGEP